MKKVLLRFSLLLVILSAHHHIKLFAQDSSHIRISLLTCTPGEELYSTFGHTAIRIIDSNSVTDNVFNYGTFNFDDPGFYTKFIRGKLFYYLSAENFEDFKYAYQITNRGITEQVLNFSAQEKIKIMEALHENIKEENRYYQYDFFFDNCTTRPRDILVNYKKNAPPFKAVMPPGTRFRQAIHQYLDKNNKYWSKLGIDLLLGAPTDGLMTTTQSQFLPDNLMKTLDSSNTNHQWVLTSANLYQIAADKQKMSFFTPVTVFALLLAVVLITGLSHNYRAKGFLQGFDGIFFFLTGATGILLIFMWVATDHAMCKNNYNLLWAWPTHIVSAFFINSKKNWVKKYFGFTAIAMVPLLLSWFFLPQQMNNAFIPVILLIIYRSTAKYFNMQARRAITS